MAKKTGMENRKGLKINSSCRIVILAKLVTSLK